MQSSTTVSSRNGQKRPGSHPVGAMLRIAVTKSAFGNGLVTEHVSNGTDRYRSTRQFVLKRDLRVRFVTAVGGFKTAAFNRPPIDDGLTTI